MWKRTVLIFFAFLFIFFVLRNLNDSKLIIETLYRANWSFLLLCLMLQLLHYLLLCLIYQKAFDVYEIRWKLKEILPMSLAALSINVFTVLAPIPGSTVFIKKGRKSGIPALNVSAAIFLAALFDYIALIPLIALSLLLLAIYYEIFIYEIVGLGVFLVLTLTLGVLLIFGIISPKVLLFLFKIFEFIVNKLHYLLKKRNYLIEGWSNSRAQNFVRLSEKLISERRKQLAIFTTAILTHMANLATLYFLFLAFGHFISITPLIIGYSLMILFWIVTPTPQGVGVVETLTPAIFSGMGVPIEAATLAVLGYRFLNLWIPIPLGYYFLHRTFNED